MKIISVEGNIGAGKTTLIRMLKDLMPDAEFLFEPIEKWQDVGGENLLEAFYKDSSRYAFLFQCRAFMTRIKQLEEKMTDPSCKDIIVIERSWFSDRMCFSQVLRDDGTITEMEWTVYKELFDQMFRFISKANMRIDKYIYVTCDTSVVACRIKERNRGEESSIPLNYLKKLKVKHDSWLNGRDDVLTIKSDDPEMNYMENPTKFKTVLRMVRQFIELTPQETLIFKINKLYKNLARNLLKFVELPPNFYTYWSIPVSLIYTFSVFLFIVHIFVLTDRFELFLAASTTYIFYRHFNIFTQMEMMCKEYDYVILDEE